MEKNPAPVDMENLPLFIGFHTSQVVVWDFFHEQYVCIYPKKHGIWKIGGHWTSKRSLQLYRVKQTLSFLDGPIADS